jgi:very-short-patch-repair endonuclease
LLFDREYKVVHEESRKLDEIKDEDGFACEDVGRLTDWIKEVFRRILSDERFDVKAVNFAGYGASFVYLDDKEAVTAPLYNYLKPYPKKLQDQFYKTYGGERVIAKQTSSPVLGNLNSGMQLYRMKYEKPELFEKIRYALHLPQYLSCILTSKLHTDITSIGCHTHLWDFEQNNYHEWVRAGRNTGEVSSPAGLYQSSSANIFLTPSPSPNGEGGAPREYTLLSLEKGRDEDFSEKDNEANESPTVFVDLPPQLLANARALRKNKTDAEDLLWQLLRNRQLNGFNFRRQHPLPKGFILDFYCAEVKLAVELDGAPHFEQEQKEYDEGRTYELKEYGIRVIRFWNEEVMKNTEEVLRKIAEACLNISSSHSSSPPAPLQMERGTPRAKAPFSGLEKGRDENFYEEDTIAVGAGLHDSSAALIPYLSAFEEPFALLSTGTWCITLNPFNQDRFPTMNSNTIVSAIFPMKANL